MVREGQEPVVLSPAAQCAASRAPHLEVNAEQPSEFGL